MFSVLGCLEYVTRYGKEQALDDHIEFWLVVDPLPEDDAYERFIGMGRMVNEVTDWEGIGAKTIRAWQDGPAHA